MIYWHTDLDLNVSLCTSESASGLFIYSQIYCYTNGPSLPIDQQVYTCLDTYIYTQSQGQISQPCNDWNLGGTRKGCRLYGCGRGWSLYNTTFTTVFVVSSYFQVLHHGRTYKTMTFVLHSTKLIHKAVLRVVLFCFWQLQSPPFTRTFGLSFQP